MTKLTQEDFVTAMGIVSKARIADRMGTRTGMVRWQTPDHMHEAFALFSAYEYRMTIGCMPCHAKVFNWLLDQVFSEVHVQTLDGTLRSTVACTPVMPCGDPDEVTGPNPLPTGLSPGEATGSRPGPQL